MDKNQNNLRLENLAIDIDIAKFKPATLAILKKWGFLGENNQFLIDKNDEFYKSLMILVERLDEIESKYSNDLSRYDVDEVVKYQDEDLQLINEQLELVCELYWAEKITNLPKRVLGKLHEKGYLSFSSKNMHTKSDTSTQLSGLITKYLERQEFSPIRGFDRFEFNSANINLFRSLISIQEKKLESAEEQMLKVIEEFGSSSEVSASQIDGKDYLSYVRSIPNHNIQILFAQELNNAEQSYFVRNRIAIPETITNVERLRVLLVQHLTKELLLANSNPGRGENFESFISRKLKEAGIKPDYSSLDSSVDNYSDIAISRALDALIYQESGDTVLDSFLSSRKVGENTLKLTPDTLSLFIHREKNLNDPTLKDRLFAKLGNRSIQYADDKPVYFTNKDELYSFITGLVNSISQKKSA